MERVKWAEPIRKLLGLFEFWFYSNFLDSVLFLRSEWSKRSVLGNFWACSKFGFVCIFWIWLVVFAEWAKWIESTRKISGLFKFSVIFCVIYIYIMWDFNLCAYRSCFIYFFAFFLQGSQSTDTSTLQWITLLVFGRKLILKKLKNWYVSAIFFTPPNNNDILNQNFRDKTFTIGGNRVPRWRSSRILERGIVVDARVVESRLQNCRVTHAQVQFYLSMDAKLERFRAR